MDFVGNATICTIAVDREKALNLFDIMKKLRDEGQSFAIVSIVAVEGSVPRKSGKLILTEEGQSFGSVGGGRLEIEAKSLASECLMRNANSLAWIENPASEAERLQNSKTQGRIQVFIEIVKPMPKLVIIGAGHVGAAIAKMASSLDFRIEIVDERPDLANRTRFPMAADIYTDPELEKALSLITIDSSAYVVIAFEANDERSIRFLINKSWTYCGMLGSRKKIASLWSKLEKEGYSRDLLSRIHAPIGIDIGAETPDEIAISVLAEILAVKNGRKPDFLKDTLHL